MDERKFRIPRGLTLSIPIDEVDKLLSQGDGTLALLYLYILRRGDSICQREAACELQRTDTEIRDAVKKLSDLGLISPAGSGKLLRPAPELPEYEAEELVSCTAGGGDFKIVVGEVQRLFGRMLSGSELKTLFGIYDHLSLPAEVILMLVNHCIEEFSALHGEGRLPSMRKIEKEAYNWSDDEIINLERAEEYLICKKERAFDLADMRRVLQIRGRDFSSTEKKYVEGWLEMGFTARALEIAYDKTVVKTGGMQWKYMNSIVTNWHSKGLHTPEEILASDLPKTVRRSAYPAEKERDKPPAERGDLERMKKILEIVKKS